MTFPFRRILPSITLLLLPLAGQAQVSEKATPILALPKTIRHAGIYTLGKDLKFKANNGAAITIASEGVTLDLGGHTLLSVPDPASANTAIGVLADGVDTVTIRHGSIEGFDIAAKLNASSNLTGKGIMLVENLHCANNGHEGIALDSNDTAVVQDCVVNHTGNATIPVPTNVWGILVEGTHVTVRNNRAVETIGGISRGVQADGNTDALVEHNVISNTAIGAGSDGIILFGFATTGNAVINNHVHGFATGLEFASGAPGKYRDNLTTNCTTAFSGGTSVGFNN